ncbi:MAG: DedA family protein [Alphaproteobacteria bacterium]
MSFDWDLKWLVDFARTNAVWAAPIVLLISFCESIIFLSILIPASVILIGFGALIAAGSLELWPILLAATVGSALGDWAAYWLGHSMKGGVARMWPIKNNPNLFHRGEAFVHRFGAMSIVIGRFIGPLRGVIPMVAGIFAMPQTGFQIANWCSAVLWAVVWLAPGFLVVKGWAMW